MTRGLFALSAAAAAIEVAAAGTIVPIDQARSVSTFLIVPQCQQDAGESDAPAGFEPFDSTLQTERDCDSGAGIGLASQHSVIDAASLTASGSGASEAHGPVLNVIHAFGTSLFDVTFELTEAAPFTLDGTIGAASSGDPVLVGAHVTLTGPGGETIHEQSLEPGAGGEPVSAIVEASGRLEAGVHRLRVEAGSFIDNEVPPSRLGSASFDVVFRVTPACPADLDGDGDVGTADLLALLAAWGTDPGGPPDLDGDGTVGTPDLLILLSTWGPCR